VEVENGKRVWTGEVDDDTEVERAAEVGGYDGWSG
jgi:hypothetical protein